MKYKKAVFLFRRDLRIEDNTGLLAACNEAETVLPCFILDPRQVTHNVYRSDNALQFMIESLKELDAAIKKQGGSLCLFYGDPANILEHLIAKGFEALFINEDYTPFSMSRDASLRRVCKNHRAGFHSFHDTLLTKPGSVLTEKGLPYKVYTYFQKEARKQTIPRPRRLRTASWCSGSFQQKPLSFLDTLLKVRNKHLFVSGGRASGLKLLKGLKEYKNYSEERNYPFVDKTTGLSAHMKFGTLSAREVYYAITELFGEEHVLINQLFWRDFYTHIAYHFPHIFGKAFKKPYESIPWAKDKKLFHAWCLGKTGFPIVDAGMRQLNLTGWMHNRVRMIVASFLVKDLHIDWRWGEKYFAQKLVDYDPCLNNGNWQWAASTGTDAQPYFRIFNPWLQQERWDTNCVYIKKWIPELRHLPIKEIHGLKKKNPTTEYPSPVVDHSVESKIAKEQFKSALN